MKRITSLLAGAALIVSLQGCTASTVDQRATGTTVRPAPAGAAVERVQTTGPALWKVADADTTIFLFGTVHLLPTTAQWMTPAIRDALASSDVMVTEILSSEMTDAAMQQQMMARGMLPQGQTLRGLLTDEQRVAYEGALQKLGIPAAAFDQFKPWMAAMTLSLLPLVQQGYTPDSGVEKVLEAQAGPHIQRAALETVEFQINVFDSMPQDAQIAYLIEVAQQADDIRPMLDRMVAAWTAGDADGLAAIMNESLQQNSDLAERLLYARNRNWADWIAARLEQPGVVFMAVGAGHLAGQNSVQDILKQRRVVAPR
ncbi:TraB/GumN family protein [Erythrobacteraceae bacterium CFH 75059]|uniref:TraB/GumN family protein n=1 Tax=Qipengyuania thermophila TaxID=2509361 RepID=UPI001022995B|nr:TraB/GumN family protein [Qipengyuania thermophila]TCD05154.1 TraB/GumN family protein [Erythrobacteraceae bacterium CFH 75059]